MEPAQQRLIHYAAVAKDSIILADHNDQTFSRDWAALASKCIAFIPDLHSRFSHTTCNLTFICLIEDLFIYCAIIDEGLSNDKAFTFLEHVRDAFQVIFKQRNVHLECFAPHSLGRAMDPFFKFLSSVVNGVSQKDVARKQQQRQQHWLPDRNTRRNQFKGCNSGSSYPAEEIIGVGNCPVQVEQSFASGYMQSPKIPLIGQGKRDAREDGDAYGGCSFMVERNLGELGSVEGAARRRWRHNIVIVVILDIFVCMLLLAIWLGVCGGLQCLEQ